MMHIIGLLFCPDCHDQKKFGHFDVSVQDPDFAECEACGYSFGKSIDETAPVGRGVVGRLSAKTVEAGWARYAKQDRVFRLENGIPLTFTPEVRKELERRQEDG